MASLPDIGFIYLIQMADFPIYKIGRSVEPEKRLSSFNVQLPFPFRRVFAYRVQEHCLVERKLHERYQERRTNGEWFRLCQLEVDEIRSLLLFWQATALEQCLIRKFFAELHDPSFDHRRLYRYGRLFLLLARRIERRVHIGEEVEPLLDLNKSEVLN